MLRTLLTVAFICTVNESAMAQDSSALTTTIQTAIKNGNNEAALTAAKQLYQVNVESGNEEGAGKAAFTQARIYDLMSVSYTHLTLPTTPYV